MNTIIIKSVPSGDFHDISIHMPDWQARFLKLVQERKPIKYDVYTMPNLSKDIQDELSKQHYCQLVLESDNDQRFLTPTSGTT
jgi:hypothetical protein